MPDNADFTEVARKTRVLAEDAKRLLSWYDAGRVQRFHIVPDYTGTPRQNLAEHSWGVAMFVDAIYQRMGSPARPAPARVLLAALRHDLAERWLGDLPANVKWAHPALSAEYGLAERDIEEFAGLTVPLTEQETAVLKWADGLECMVYSKRRGGAYMEAYWNIVDYYAVRKKGPDLPVAYELMQEIMRYI